MARNNKLAQAIVNHINKKAAYPFYEMVKDTTPLYTPNDPIGVQSGTEDTEQIVNLFPEINKDMLNTDFVQKGYSNEYPFTQVDIDQLQKGIEVELEHTTDRNVAAKIALDHLAEISNYYDLLEEMEQKAKEMGTYLLNKENKVNE